MIPVLFLVLDFIMVLILVLIWILIMVLFLILVFFCVSPFLKAVSNQPPSTCRFLGLQVVFVCGALLCFLLIVITVHRKAKCEKAQSGTTKGYEMVGEKESNDVVPPKEKDPA